MLSSPRITPFFQKEFFRIISSDLWKLDSKGNCFIDSINNNFNLREVRVLPILSVNANIKQF